MMNNIGHCGQRDGFFNTHFKGSPNPSLVVFRGEMQKRQYSKKGGGYGI